MKRKTTSEVSDNSTLENQNIVVLFLKTAKNSSRYPNNWSTVQLSKIRPYFAKLIDRCAGLRHISPIGCSVHPVAVRCPPCQLCLKGASLARCCSLLLFVFFTSGGGWVRFPGSLHNRRLAWVFRRASGFRDERSEARQEETSYSCQAMRGQLIDTGRTRTKGPVSQANSRAKLAVWWPRVPVDSVRNSMLAYCTLPCHWSNKIQKTSTIYPVSLATVAFRCTPMTLFCLLLFECNWIRK